jgi:catechol 2,3-dioxygenase-like lactoylglutathione lyase family enzyme
MPIIAFDHVNLRTANLDGMAEFYQDVLGLMPGARPKVSVAGRWLYLGEQPYVHLVAVTSNPTPGENVTLEHFAFRATGLSDFLADLDARGIDYSLNRIPEYPFVQVNLHDPDGNHIHVDFPSDEAA